MSISSSEKIFIDPREEITFIVERLLKAEKDRIILVVPQNSLLLSSLVSIDILFRKLVRTKKLAVIVSEDEYGKAISSKAGFVVVDKVSQITNDQWNLANNKKMTIKEVLEERKEALLANISGEHRSVVDLPELPDVEAEEFVVSANELNESVEENNKTFEAVLEEQNLEDGVTEEIMEDEYIEEPIVEEKSIEEKELESSLKKYAKPRREAKEIDLDGIKLISGGDVKSFIDSLDSVKMASNNSFTQMSDEKSFERKIKKVGSSSFTGKDFTKQITEKGGIGAFFSKFSLKRRNPDFRDKNDFVKKKNRKRILLITFLMFLSLFAGSGYILAFQVSSVDINLKLRAQDVSTSATILISTKVTEMSLESPITIPAKEYSILPENLSISKTGTADGSAKRGVKSKGVVTIYNLQTESVDLPAGAKFKNLTNNLTYLLVSAVTLEPATVAANIKTPSSKDSIALEAEAFGPQYNIEVDEKTRFSIENYSTEEEVSATAFQSFTGGTEESFTSVSQENYDKLKDTIVPDLKKQGLERLKSLTENGYQLIEGTVVYDESKQPEAFPKVGEEAKDKIFNLTVQIGIKGFAVRTQNLIDAVSTVLKNNTQNNGSGDLQIGDIADPQIDKVEKNGDDYVLTVSSKGSVKTQIAQEQMKKDIAGLSIKQAEDYFRLIDYIESYNLSFNPGIVPEGLQRVPSETARINIRTR